MQVCLLDQEQIQRSLDLQSSKPTSLTLRYLPGKEFRVLHEGKEGFLVPQTRLEKWQIPGSQSENVKKTLNTTHRRTRTEPSGPALSKAKMRSQGAT